MVTSPDNRPVSPDASTYTWDSHQFTDRAVLCFIRTDKGLLLINKKRGLGAGKVNAPGGRLEPGETALEAAVRETVEEVCLTPVEPREYAELSFIFLDGYSLSVTVFIALNFTGTPCETDEALPFWCPEESIPYDRMWADDILWLPSVLQGMYVRGYFIFDGDLMLSKQLLIDGVQAAD